MAAAVAPTSRSVRPSSSGFPGETDADFELLLDWLGEARLDRVGAFPYEPVSGAPANDLGLPPVPDEVKSRRFKRFMEKQQAISASIQRGKVGKRLPVLIDTVENGVATGRTRADAPGIDGAAHVASRRPLRPGDLVTMKVERAEAYDLWGVAV